MTLPCNFLRLLGLSLRFPFSIGEMTSFSPERTITIRGPTLEAISAAEEKISSKLRAAWENDMSVGQPQPGPPPFMQFPHPEPFMLPGMGPAVPPYLPSPQSRFGPTTTGVIEVTQAWIPNSLVGSLIGTKGNLNTLMRARHVAFGIATERLWSQVCTFAM